MKNIHSVLCLVFLGLCLAWPTSGVFAKGTTQKRCGWLENPTPANWWLRDRDGEWTLSVQGGYQVPGIAEMPDMTTKGWVVTNAGGYGYGCACMEVQVNKKTHDVTRLISAHPLPIKQCKADRTLPAPY